MNDKERHKKALIAALRVPIVYTWKNHGETKDASGNERAFIRRLRPGCKL